MRRYLDTDTDPMLKWRNDNDNWYDDSDYKDNYSV